MATTLAPSRMLLVYEMTALDRGRESDPDAGHPGEREVTAWIAALLACMCVLPGVFTWVIH